MSSTETQDSSVSSSRTLASTRRRLLLGGALAAVVGGLPARASGQDASTRSLVVPFSAGSMLDLYGRTLAEALSEPGAPRVLVENHPGASGVIAARQVLRRPALLLGTSGLICNTPLLARTPLGFDPLADLVPVCALARTPFVLFAAADHAASNLKELQALGRKANAPLLYAGADTGSANHVAGEVLFEMLGVASTHVPYRQNQQAYLDVVEKRIDLGIFSWQNVAPLVRSGKAKVLALLSNSPITVVPSLQTPAAQGFGRFDIQGWYGIFTGKDHPEALPPGYDRRIESAARSAQVLNFLAESGQEPLYLGSADFRAFILDETARYRAVLQRLKLT